MEKDKTRQVWIREKLAELHREENLYNLEIGKIDKHIRHLTNKKKKLAQEVSKNMRSRNKFINLL